MKKGALSLLSAFLLMLSFPPVDLGILAWVAFLPLFFALEETSFKEALFFSWGAGFVFFLGLLQWIHHVTWAGTIVLALYLSLYFALFGIGIKYFNSSWGLLFLPSLWVTLEFWRGTLFTGFGWALLGYSQWKFLDLIQIAEWTGAYGVSFLVMLGNVALYQLFRKRTRRRERFFSLLLFLILSGSAVGYALVYPHPSTAHFFRVSVIQGNIPQDLKWDATLQETILEKYEALTRTVAKNHPGTEVIFWPETAVPGFLPDEKPLLDRLAALSRDSGKSLLVGSPWVENRLVYNSALFWKEGRILQRYDKLHLVPFGEFIPFEEAFPFLREWIVTGDFHPGQEATLFKHPQATFATLICFEDLFPDLVRRFATADFLVNMTNDAWFGKSGAPFQHAQASVFRAVENRKSMLRVTNTGYSCLIDPTGRILQDIEIHGEKLFVTGWRSWEVPLSKEQTFYTRHGDLFAWGCLGTTLLGMALLSFLSLSATLANRK